LFQTVHPKDQTFGTDCNLFSYGSVDFLPQPHQKYQSAFCAQDPSTTVNKKCLTANYILRIRPYKVIKSGTSTKSKMNLRSQKVWQSCMSVGMSTCMNTRHQSHVTQYFYLNLGSSAAVSMILFKLRFDSKIQHYIFLQNWWKMLYRFAKYEQIYEDKTVFK